MRTPFPTLGKPPVWPAGLGPVSTTAALWREVRFVGARPAKRDAIEKRIVADALMGTARIIDSQEEVGGYPKHAPTKRALNVPDKGGHAWLEKLSREVTLGSSQ